MGLLHRAFFVASMYYDSKKKHNSSIDAPISSLLDVLDADALARADAAVETLSVEYELWTHLYDPSDAPPHLNYTSMAGCVTLKVSIDQTNEEYKFFDPAMSDHPRYECWMSCVVLQPDLIMIVFRYTLHTSESSSSSEFFSFSRVPFHTPRVSHPSGTASTPQRTRLDTLDAAAPTKPHPSHTLPIWASALIGCVVGVVVHVCGIVIVGAGGHIDVHRNTAMRLHSMCDGICMMSHCGIPSHDTYTPDAAFIGAAAMYDGAITKPQHRLSLYNSDMELELDSLDGLSECS